jgi:hypothetical protein
MSEARCFRIDAADNVATLLSDAIGGKVQVVGGDEVELLEEIRLGHKVAMGDIRRGEAIVKFGIRIGRASVDIRRGQWVHLHNCASDFDDRSQRLDVHSGAATDTRYE